MKLNQIIRTSLTALLILTSINLVAQTRHKVVSLVKQKQSNEWYAEQAQLWGEYLDANPEDGDAWLNFYTANRMLKIQAQERTQEDLDKIVEQMGSAIPNSFEFHYVSYWNPGNSASEENFHHLRKAYEIAPNRPETFDDFFTYYLLRNNREKLEEIAQKWYASNDISPGLYNWSYNMLMSCEQDAVLLTHGDNDTYPALILQLVQNIRPDIKLMNVHLLLIDQYRHELFEEAGIKRFEDRLADAEAFYPYLQSIYGHIRENTDRPVYLSMGNNPAITEKFDGELYNVGLAWKWELSKFDNIAVMKKNYEKNYRLDYIRHQFHNDISQGVVDHANSNYLPSMLTLYNHYVESDDANQFELKDLIDHIAKKNNMQDRVESVFAGKNRNQKVEPALDYKEIMELFVKIDDELYAMRTEVSNELYSTFLEDLVKQKRFDDLKIAENPQVDWRSLLPEKINNLPDEDIFQNGHPDDEKSPAVNMTYEAALLFASWLVEQYELSDHRKKTHDKVEFTLPTEDEWEYLALGKSDKRAYAWNGQYLRNKRGCFLSNLDVSEVEEKPTECESCNEYNLDGAIFPVGVETYMPNEFELYNMTGNVSEMVKEKGVSKGGSWNTPGGIAYISNSFTFDGANAETGFRLVMHVK